MKILVRIACCMIAMGLNSCSKVLVQEDQAILKKWQNSPYGKSLTLEGTKPVNFSSRLEGFWSLLRPHSTCVYAISDQDEDILVCHERLFSLFGEVCGHNSRFYPLVATVTEESQDFEITTQLLSQIHTSTLSPFAKKLLTYEALAKILAYRTCKVGQEFSIHEGEDLVTYRIDSVFMMGGFVPAYGCIPMSEKGSPLLLFRGSEFSSNERGKATFKANVDMKGPGYTMYMNARSELRNWLEKQTIRMGKAKVIGFSLGGTLASYALVYEGEFFYEGITFNMAGVRKKIVKDWEQTPRELRPKFISYVTRGDAVSKIGNLFGEVYEFSFPTPRSLIKAHNILILAQPKVFINPVDLEKEKLASRLLDL